MNRLTKKLSSLLKTDMQYLMSGAFWSGIIQSASLLSSFALVIVLGHLLTKSAYGEYKYLITVAGVIESLGLSGLSTALIQSVARGHDRTLQVAFRENLRWSFLILIACIGLSIYYGFKGNIAYTFSFIVIGFLLPLIKSTSLWSSYLTAKKKFKANAVMYIVFIIIFTAFLIATVIHSGEIIGIVVAYFLCSLVLNALMYLTVIRLYPPENDSVDTHAVTYAAHLSVINILHTIADRADSILVFAYLGPTNLAIYTFAVAMPEQIKGFFKSFSSIILPKFSLKTPKELQSIMLKRILQVMAFTSTVVILYVVVAPYIFKFLFPQYLGSVLYSQVYAVSLIIVTASLLPTTALRALVTKKELYKLNISASIILIGLLFGGIKYYSIWGAIAAITITRLYRLIYSYILLKNVKHVEVQQPISSPATPSLVEPVTQ